MEINLSENIRKLRKEKGLTQEALSEALGVTVGAVYKWEARLSMPEIGMLVKMADLFDVSVDLLLGYKLKDNHREAMAQRLLSYIRSRDTAGLEEAEKALVKFPNDYWIVYDSACMYQGFGLEAKDKSMMRRAIELFERAIRIIPPDADPRYGEAAIQGSIASLYYFLGERDKAIEFLRKHNPAGVYNAQAGVLMALQDASDPDTHEYLTQAYIASVSNLTSTFLGFATICIVDKKYKKLRELADWYIDLIEKLRREGMTCFLDKWKCTFYTVQAYSYLGTKDEKTAEEILKQARDLAEKFDEAPDYHFSSMRFVESQDVGEASGYDTLGETAIDAIDFVIEMIGDKRFTAMWKKINE